VIVEVCRYLIKLRRHSKFIGCRAFLLLCSLVVVLQLPP
jgi:hypothetical protein